MLRSDLLASVAASRGKYAAAACGERLASAVRGRKRSLIYVGTALALAGAGSASAATVGGCGTRHRPHLSARTVPGTVRTSPHAPPRGSTHKVQRARPPRTRPRPPARHQVGCSAGSRCGTQINRQTNPAAARHGKLPLADRLMPVGTSGPQAWMPMSPRAADQRHHDRAAGAAQEDGHPVGGHRRGHGHAGVAAAEPQLRRPRFARPVPAAAVDGLGHGRTDHATRPLPPTPS